MTYRIYGLVYIPANRIVYVGRTSRELKRRLTEHKRDAKKCKMEIHKFINCVGKNNFRIKELRKTECKEYALFLEGFYINKMNTRLCGCNEVGHTPKRTDDGYRNLKTSLKNKHNNPMKNEDSIERMKKKIEKPIICYTYNTNELVGEYSGITNMCKELNLDRRSVHRVLEGKYKHHHNFIFEYKEEKSNGHFIHGIRS